MFCIMLRWKATVGKWASLCVVSAGFLWLGKLEANLARLHSRETFFSRKGITNWLWLTWMYISFLSRACVVRWYLYIVPFCCVRQTRNITLFLFFQSNWEDIVQSQTNRGREKRWRFCSLAFGSTEWAQRSCEHIDLRGRLHLLMICR